MKVNDFSIKKGPIFANFVLADEINRAPAKVQSALLEAMQEKQVTIGETTFTLDKPFLVMATQNPIEQEGTYPLPEAQLDRFMFNVMVKYPTFEEELAIVEGTTSNKNIEISKVISSEEDFIFNLSVGHDVTKWRKDRKELKKLATTIKGNISFYTPEVQSIDNIYVM